MYLENLKINGTFDEFMESVRVQVDELINSKEKLEQPWDYPLEVNMCEDGSWIGENGPLPGKKIHINVKYQTDAVYFSIAESEFNRHIEEHWDLYKLVQVRIKDMLYDVETIRSELFRTIKRFDPNWKTCDLFEH